MSSIHLNVWLPADLQCVTASWLAMCDCQLTCNVWLPADFLENFYATSNLNDLFHNINPKCIICFIHAIGLTNSKLPQAGYSHYMRA